MLGKVVAAILATVVIASLDVTSESIGETMEKHQVVPDIIDQAPKAILEVSWKNCFTKISQSCFVFYCIKNKRKYSKIV